MSDNISRKAAIDALWELRRNLQMMDNSQGADITMHGVFLAEKKIEALPSTDRKGHWMSFEQVADMLSVIFGRCACDVNDNDDWLPFACKYADTECPNPKEENGCWMQFLLQGGADMRGESNVD